MARFLYFDPDMVAFNRLKQIIGSRDGHTCDIAQKEFGEGSLNSKEIHELLYCDSWPKFDKTTAEQAYDFLIIGTERVLKGTEEQVTRVQDLKPAGGATRIPVILVDHAVDRKKLVAVSKLRVEDFWIKPYDEPLLIQKLDLLIVGGNVEAQVFNFGTKTPTHVVFDAEVASIGPFGLAVRLRKPIRSGEMVQFSLKTTSQEKIYEMDLSLEARCLQSVDLPNHPTFKHQGLFVTWGIPMDKMPRFKQMANALRRKNSLIPLNDSLNRATKVLEAIETKITAAYRAGQTDQKISDISAKKAVWRKRLTEAKGKLTQMGTQLGAQMDNAAWDLVRGDTQNQLTEFEKELSAAIVPLIRSQQK